MRSLVFFLVCSLLAGIAGCYVSPMPGDDVFGRPPVPPIPPVGIDWGNNHPVLDDPEVEGEAWTDYVFADDGQQALRRCQAIANSQGWVRLESVRKVGNIRYECRFRSVG